MAQIRHSRAVTAAKKLIASRFFALAAALCLFVSSSL
jgi:hypothetical protein